MKFGIIMGSTREGRVSPGVAAFVKEVADQRSEHEFEIIDILDYDLPFLGTGEGDKRWNDKIAELDGYIFVAQEYNHSMSAALKNAIDHAREEWFNKAAGIVSYGSAGGVRAAEHLRQVMGEQYVAVVRTNPAFSLFTDFENFSQFRPGDHHLPGINDMLDELLLWSKAFKTIR